MIRPGDDVAVVTAFDDRWLEFVLFDHGDDLRRGWGLSSPPRRFFAVAGDEGHGRAVIEQGDGSGDLRGGSGEFLGEGLGDVHGYNGLC
mgnify:CR=1 FL=1